MNYFKTVFYFDKIFHHDSFVQTPQFILMEGGVPIIVDDACVGAVGVSGVLPNQDAQVAKAGVAALQ